MKTIRPNSLRLPCLLGRPLGLLLLGLCGLTMPSASAGTINVNLTDTVATGLGADGTGILGGGVWNRIDNAQAAGANALVKSNGAATGVTMTGTAPDTVAAVSPANGNLIQSDTWFSPLSSVTLTFSGLIPRQVYKVAYYSPRGGFVATSVTPTVNGLSRTLPYPGVAATALPGTNGIDFATFIVNATPAGVITLTAGSVAGVQIQGVLTGETGPQVDCLITTSPVSLLGKTNNVYNVNSNNTQFLIQRSGGRSKNFYVNVQTDGPEIDNLFLMGFWDRTKLNVVITDRTTRANVSAQAKALRYRFNNDTRATRRFVVKVGPTRIPLAAASTVGVFASPSTLSRPKQDGVVAILAP